MHAGAARLAGDSARRPSITTLREYKPLAAASQHLRQLERERRLVAKLPGDVPSFPPLSNGEVAAALRQSLDDRTKRIEHIYNQVSCIALNGAAVELEQLSAVLALYEHRIAVRNTPKGHVEVWLDHGRSESARVDDAVSSQRRRVR
jgi:hypothetical protein